MYNTLNTGSHVGSGRIIKSIDFNDRENIIINNSVLRDGKKVRDFQSKYLKYRNDWLEQPKKCIRENIFSKKLNDLNIIPLCIDIETAAICDLACPFCFRQYSATPDNIIDASFCYNIIDQAAELGVPSIKFNWRGEPLLHPKLPDFIAYAKKQGILETIINTNATQLNEKKAKELISAGLDFMIYSFDGGTKETYEKMRPGRFRKNKFLHVYENIKNFHSIRKEHHSALPYTKIQMIMTDITFNEKDSFFELFSDIVDDVSISQYSERGGEVTDIDEATRERYEKVRLAHGLPEGTPYMRDPQGTFFLSKQRKPCEQPFQRLMVTYEGRVAMCCYDWGATHPVGFLSPDAYQNGSEYEKVVERAKKGHKGFELLSNIEKSKEYNHPHKKVQSLAEIWYGDEINEVRKRHIDNDIDAVEICKGCTFKDTYEWIPIHEENHNTIADSPVQF